MEEKEIKIILKISLHKFISKITQAGYQFSGKEKQEDVYWDTPDYDLYQQVAALRVRNRKTLAFKKLLYPKRKWYVVETEIPFNQKLGTVLKHLGYSPKYTITKSRTKFLKDKNEIVIDDIKGLGTVVELECQSDDPLEKVNEILKASEWERTVEGTGNLWLRKHLGFTHHLQAIDRFKKNPNWNL